MANKFKETIKGMLAGDSKKIKIIVAVGLIGIVLIFASDLLAGNEKKAKNDNEGSIKL